MLSECLSWWFGICFYISPHSSLIRLKDINLKKIRKSYSDRHRLKSVGSPKAIGRR